MMNLLTSGLVLLSAGSLRAQYSNAVNQVLDDPFNRAVLAASSEATMARNSVQPALNMREGVLSPVLIFSITFNSLKKCSTKMLSFSFCQQKTNILNSWRYTRRTV